MLVEKDVSLMEMNSVDLFIQVIISEIMMF